MNHYFSMTHLAPKRSLLRIWLVSVAVVGLTFAAASYAAPDTAIETPEALVQRLTSDVLEGMKADPSIRTGNRQSLVGLIEAKVLPNVDFEKTTRLASGKYWRQATPDQQKALVAEFESTLLRIYGGALSAVKPQTVIEVRPGRYAPDATDVVVRTLIRQPDGDPITVDYRLERTGDAWKVYDFGVMNVWLVENYRNQFSSLIAAGGVDGLIKSLAERNRSAMRPGTAVPAV